MNSPGWVGISAKFCEMLDETCPLSILMAREVPSLVICRLGSAGGTGIDLGSPPLKLSVKVAVSPTVTGSRSSVAVKGAASRVGGADQSSRMAKANGSRSPVRLRLRGLRLFHDGNLRIVTFA